MANEEGTPVDRQLAKIEDMTLDDSQLAEQLYSSAGLNPVVEAGLKDYDKRLQTEDKMITKVFGPRGSDIKGYGESVAKRVAVAVYALLNRQYGGQMGDLRSYILTLADEHEDKYHDAYGADVDGMLEFLTELRDNCEHTYRIKDNSGNYWTGSTWGVIGAEYTYEDLPLWLDDLELDDHYCGGPEQTPGSVGYLDEERDEWVAGLERV